MDRFQGRTIFWFEGHEFWVWKKGIYPTTEMIHRGDAQMNSCPYDPGNSAEDSYENSYRSLFVGMGIMLVAVWRAFEETDMIWYDMIWYDTIWYDMIWYDMMIQASSSTVQPHSQYVLAKESMNIS